MADPTPMPMLAPAPDMKTGHNAPSTAATPYGGFTLQYGDTDKAPRWGGMTSSSQRATDPNAPHPSDAKHAKKAYVQELMEDLLILGYLSPSRARDMHVVDNQAFTMDVAAAVLALKYDLVGITAPGVAGEDGYQVPFVSRLASINPNPTPSSPGPIYFTRDWGFPRACLIEAQHVHDYLADKKSQRYAKYAREVDLIAADLKPRSLKYRDVNQPETFDNSEAEYKRICELLATQPPLKDIATLKARRSALEGQFAALAAHLVKAAVPLTHATQIVSACAASLTQLTNTINKTADIASEWNSIDLSSDTFFQERNNLAPRGGSPENYYNGTRDNIVSTLETDMTKYVRDTLSDIAALRKRAEDAGPGALSLSNAAQDFERTLSDFKRSISDFITTVKAYDFKPAAERYHKMVRRYSLVDGATAFCIKQMVKTRSINGRRCFVSPAGALTQFPVLDGVEVGAPKEKAQPSVSEETLQKLFAKIAGGVEAQRGIPIPVRIVFHTLANESGGKHAANHGSLKRVPLCGTDFDNYETPFHAATVGKAKERMLVHDAGQRVSFDEFETNPSRGYITSRGWGITQVTPPLVGEDLLFGYYVRKEDDALEDHTTDSKRRPRSRRGLPLMDSDRDIIPFYIGSAEGSLWAGVRLMVAKFQATYAKRRCTFERLHACDDCLSRFTAADFSFAPGTIEIPATKTTKRIPAKPGAYEISENGFKKIQEDRTKTAISAGLAAEPSDPVGAPAEPDDHDRREWPCSWLTVRMAYAGIGQEGFGYIRQVVTMAGNANKKAQGSGNEKK